MEGEAESWWMAEATADVEVKVTLLLPARPLCVPFPGTPFSAPASRTLLRYFLSPWTSRSADRAMVRRRSTCSSL